jgi:hypothetical protein
MLIIGTTIGCAASYGPMSLEGGYASRELEPGVHYIDYLGSPTVGRETLVRFWHRRASEVCPGGYDILPDDEAMPLSEPWAPSVSQTAGIYNARGRVKCKDSGG